MSTAITGVGTLDSLSVNGDSFLNDVEVKGTLKIGEHELNAVTLKQLLSLLTPLTENSTEEQKNCLRLYYQTLGGCSASIQ